MQDASQQFNLGSVNSRFGQLTFTLVVSNNENAHLEIYASDPKDMRKSGVLFIFVESSYQILKDLIAKTDEAVEKLKQSGQIHKMAISHSRDKQISKNNVR